MIKDSCTTRTRDAIIKVSEKKSRHATFKNAEKGEFLKIAYDGCCKLNETACDWLLAREGIGTLAIELKGCDIDHACEQIEKTFDDIRKDGRLPQKLAGLIVCSRVPRVDTKFQRASLRLAKKYKAPLRLKEDAREVSFTNLFNFG